MFIPVPPCFEHGSPGTNDHGGYSHQQAKLIADWWLCTVLAWSDTQGGLCPVANAEVIKIALFSNDAQNGQRKRESLCKPKHWWICSGVVDTLTLGTM